MRVLLVPVAGLILMGSAAPSAQSSPPPVIEVLLANYEFTPATLHFRTGEEQVLRLINMHGSHSFSAPELFAASRIDPGSAARIDNGKVELREGDQVDIHLTPQTAGNYPIRCTHLMHSNFGMKGEAIVG